MQDKTELYFNAKLEADPRVIPMLKYMLQEKDEGMPEVPNHNLFKCRKWKIMIQGSGVLKFLEAQGTYTIKISSKVINDDHEVSNFIDWIMPNVISDPGAYLGCFVKKGELPTLICKNGRH